MIVFLFICQANFALQKNQMREKENEVYCIECNDGSIEKLNNFWSKLFVVDPCKQNGGVKVYKCRKCQ